MSPSNLKGKGKVKARSCNRISIALKKSNSEVNRPTDSEDEVQVLAINPVVAATRSGKEFAKEHDQMAIDPSKSNAHTPPEAVQTPLEDMAGISKQGEPPSPLPPPSKPTTVADKRPELRFSK